MILPCNCKSEYQDKKYGKDKRVHNTDGGVSLKQKYAYCTVCGTKRGVNGVK